jgi:hypothetical protein
MMKLRWLTPALLALLVAATAGAAWEAKRLADTAEQILGHDRGGQADMAIRSALATGSRAWVGPSGAKILHGIAKSSPATVEVMLRNTGKEPALNLSWSLQRFVSDPDEASAKELTAKISAYVTQCLTTPAKPGQAVLFPTSDAGAGLTLATTYEATIVDDGIVGGTKLLAVETCLAYETAAQTRHTAFCYFYNAKTSEPQNLTLCEVGNHAD